MKRCVCFLFMACVSMAQAQLTLVVTKNRPAVMDVSAYKQIAIGDIVGASGIKNENSLELADELTAKLFNAKTYEIVDRNALVNILSGQKNNDIKLINESTISALSKKLNTALLIIGRLQNEVITHKQNSDKNGTTPCGMDYWWEAKYELTVQLKIIDVKTGNLIYSKPVTYTKNMESTKTCTVTEKFKREDLAMQAIPKLADEITKIVIPYTEEMTLYFDRPLLALLKNPLKKTESAVNFLQFKAYDKGLAILKQYATDKSLKGSTLGKAAYNYGLGLYANNQYEEAKEQFKAAMDLGLINPLAGEMLQQIDKEKVYDSKLVRK